MSTQLFCGYWKDLFLPVGEDKSDTDGNCFSGPKIWSPVKEEVQLAVSFYVKLFGRILERFWRSEWVWPAVQLEIEICDERWSLNVNYRDTLLHTDSCRFRGRLFNKTKT